MPESTRSAAEVAELFEDDTYFLSPTNPIATADTRDIEQEAISMLDAAQVVDGRNQALYRNKVLGKDAPSEALEGLERKMDEWTFHYTTLACNFDSNHPRVLGSVYGPPHQWFGSQIPGHRGLGTGENVDNNYSLVPVDGASRFELYGKVSAKAPIGDCPMYITSNLSMSRNVNGLDWRTVQISDDGTFVVTIGPEPADGRPNHLQTSPDARWLFIRDGRKNWDQIPNAYRIRRLDPPLAAPHTRETKLELARRFIIDDVPANFFFSAMMKCLEPNKYEAPVVSDIVGGMPTQRIARAYLKLEDDEAFVVTVRADDSDYWVAILNDWWLMSLDFFENQTSLNNTQAVPNPDGSYTLVYSIQDPGVHNWIDTMGLHETLMLHRFQLLPIQDGVPQGELVGDGKLVKLEDLDRVLPSGTKRVTAEERQLQLAQRRAGVDQRYAV